MVTAKKIKLLLGMKKNILLAILFLSFGVCSAQKEIRSNSSNKNILVGCWWTPHAATVKIHFAKNGTFVFNDIDSVLKGKYYLTKGTITLAYNDRKPQSFYLKYYIDSDNKPYYEIYKKGYGFVKDIENSDCNF